LLLVRGGADYKKSAPLALAYAPKSATLAAGCEDGTIQLWDGTTGKLMADLGDHPDEVCALVFSPDGTLLASASKDGIVMLWRMAPRPRK
jgi:WD40 repeat protein